MKATEALLLVSGVCVGVRKSQIKTLADLVSVAIDIGRVSLSELGRLLAEERRGLPQTPSSGLGGLRATLACILAMPCKGPVPWLFGSRKHWQNHPFVVRFDWTKVRSFDTLTVARLSVGGSAAVPDQLANGSNSKSQNNLQESMLWRLRSLLPEWVRGIVVADRAWDVRNWHVRANNWASTM